MILSETISTLFEESLRNIKLESNSTVFSKYCDFLEEEKVYELSQSVEDSLISESVNKRVVRKVFHSIVESFQNIRKHGMKCSDGRTFGAFILKKEQTKFVIHFISALQKTLMGDFQKSVSFVNSLDKKELKAHYLQVLGDGEYSDKGGAGLGLVTIALKATGGISITETEHNNDATIVNLSYHIDA